MSRKHKLREEVWAVVRFDDYLRDELEQAFTIKAVFHDRVTAEAEADRLNQLNAGKGCRYWATFTRLFPRDVSAGSEES